VRDVLAMTLSFGGVAVLSLATWWTSMQSGVRALETMDNTPG
jgi:hypothetical protein